ncbi:Apoptosis-inducing factor 1 [Apiospora phragmitis]|uniref:Apoptosis-inducing factor 1 n=1 Tax=Apiospora phragmitis TaxID=2905665 RepID=A0ABR1VQP1_9PEZI
MNSARSLILRPVIARATVKPNNFFIAQKRISIVSFQFRAMSEFKLKDLSSLSLQPGEKQEVEVEGIEGGKVLLANVGGKIQALGPKCTHYGAPLVKGVMTKSGRITCPWHGACFNGKTGDVEDAPALDSLPVFKVIEKDGAVYVQGEEATIKAGRRQPNLKSTSATKSEKVVVVGGGSGGLGLVQGLREKGYGGKITMITNEGVLPIDRTKLSKALMTDVSKLQWRNDEWFKTGSVDVVQQEVSAVDFGSKEVTTKAGGKFSYDKLVLGNIFMLRNVENAKDINNAIGDKGKRIVIVGSSFIGMELANCVAADNNVTVIGMENTPLERVLGKEVGAGLQKSLEGKGVKFHMGASVDKAEPSSSDPSKVGSVVLKDGTKLEADLVVLGIGVSPATEYLRENKVVRLEEDGSLKTDEQYSVVGLKDVYAIGDIASFPYKGPGGEGKYVRIEHWNVAQQSGRIVAGQIVNPSIKPEFFTPIFWSALGAQMRYCGNTSNGYDDLILNGNPAEANFVAYYCKGETVVALASMGRDPVMSQAAELMRRGKMPSKSEIKGGLDILSLGPPE